MGLAPATAGGVLWLSGYALLDPPLAVALVLLGPLVAVPLAIHLVADAPRERLLLWAAPLAAAPLLQSFALPPGPEAALWSAPWLVWTVLAAAFGALRLLEDGLRPPSELAMGAAHLFVAVGGVWLTISRWGLVVAGFEEPVPLLTAAHFHFAGFVLPVLAGLAARRAPGPTTRTAAILIVVGMPLLATGIVAAAGGIVWIEPVGVLVVVAAGLLVAVAQVRLVASGGPVLARTLWVVSALSVVAGLTLALSYGVGRHFGLPHPDIAQMVGSHAVLNAVGFALGGLAAWQVAGTPPRPPHLRLRLSGEPVPRPTAHPKATGTGVGAQHDAYRIQVGTEPPGPPVPGGPWERVAARIRRFDIFPPQSLQAGQDADVEAGRVIVCAHSLAGLRLVFEGRVTALVEGPGRCGFGYETLEGHPEQGNETFLVEKDGQGRVWFSIESWSRPQHPLVRAFPKMARRRQKAAARSALRRMQEIGGGG